jgi:hypothetical protein
MCTFGAAQRYGRKYSNRRDPERALSTLTNLPTSAKTLSDRSADSSQLQGHPVQVGVDNLASRWPTSRLPARLPIWLVSGTRRSCPPKATVAAKPRRRSNSLTNR